MPSTSKKLADTRAPGSCSGRSPSVALNCSLAIAASPLSMRSRVASSTNEGYENGPSAMARFGFEADRMNTLAASLNGRGRSNAASTMLKTAVFAPMAIAMIATATRVNSRAFSRERIAYRIDTTSQHVTSVSGNLREAARNTLRRRPGITGPWADQLARRIFLNRVSDPADRSAQRKEEQRSLLRQPVGARHCGQAEIQVRSVVQQLRSCLLQIANRPPFGFVAAGLRQLHEQHGARIASRVQGMAEPRTCSSPLRRSTCNQGPRALWRSGLRQQRTHPRRGSPVPISLQCRHSGGNDVIRRGAGRSRAPGGKRRHVQLMVGTQDERRSNHVADRVPLRRPGGLQNPVNGLPRVMLRDDCRQQAHDACACLPDRRRTQVIRRQVVRLRRSVERTEAE